MLTAACVNAGPSLPAEQIKNCKNKNRHATCIPVIQSFENIAAEPQTFPVGIATYSLPHHLKLSLLDFCFLVLVGILSGVCQVPTYTYCKRLDSVAHQFVM
jgi:hypothetical protein